MSFIDMMRTVCVSGIRGLQCRSCQVILVVVAYLLLVDLLPQTAHQCLYTVSVVIKDLLIWMLPLTVGVFIAHTICGFERRAPVFVIALILFEGISNLASVWYAYVGGHLAAGFLPSIQVSIASNDFNALLRLPFARPSWWSTNNGMLFGLVLGCIAALTQRPALKHIIGTGKDVVQWVLTRIFSRLVPLFVLGFVARMYQTKILNHAFLHYGVFLIWLLVLLTIYISILFLIGNRGDIRESAKSLRNLLPAGGLALTSGCSLSTMPWTIDGAAKNLRTPGFAKAVIPATTNIQQVGDCITNAFLCFLVYRHFYGCSPDFFTWLNFSIVFVLARYATAAILGGAIFIMIPIYETYLSFNAEMIAIIMAFNVILDPLVTASNVVANGALCRVFERVWDKVVGVAQEKAV
jgi:hypothetical protein